MKTGKHFKCLPFLEMSTYAWKITPFSWIRASHWKNTPSFAKMGTSMGVCFGRELWEGEGEI